MLRFSDLEDRLQKFRADYIHSKYHGFWRWTDPDSGVEKRVYEADITEEHRSLALQKYRSEASGEAEEKWDQ